MTASARLSRRLPRVVLLARAGPPFRVEFPAGNTASDWTFWSNLLLETAR